MENPKFDSSLTISIQKWGPFQDLYTSDNAITLTTIQ